MLPFVEEFKPQFCDHGSVRDMEGSGREDSQRWERTKQEISVIPHPITDENCLLRDLLNEVFGSMGLVLRLPSKEAIFSVAIKGGVDLLFSGIKDGADEVRGGGDLRSQDVKGAYSCDRFSSGEGKALERAHADS